LRKAAPTADLVKGKLTGVPVAVVRGPNLHDNGSNANNSEMGQH
jgi:coenzyme F420-0:L-glutamate ligase/coenzyme F420-1:gamma-L-glutamate ligase